jgi:signal transduction histidine kinase
VNPKSGAFTVVASQGHPYWAIGEDAAGRIWLSDTRNIGYVANGAFVPVRDVANAAVEEVASFKQDSRGQLWAIAAGAGVYRVAPGIPRLEIKSPRASQDFLMSDRLGTWVSLSSGGVEQHLDGRTYAFPDDQPERIDSLVRTIMDDGDSIWITTRRGLRRWRHGIWTTWTRDHGLPGTGSTEEILVDRLGHFWLMTTRGLLRLPRAQLDATPDGVPRMLSFARIGVTEGVAPLGGGAASSPRALVDRHGRLHIATLDSVVTIDPSAVIPSSMAPPIVLESATVDHHAVDLTRTQSFVEPSLLQFDYTSLSLRSPELARFRYRLDGYDTEWTEAGSRRHVTYGVLRPGSYRFRVIGAGAEGVWNETGASFAFQITPVFWRTWWFRATLLGIASLVVAALYRLRVRQLTRQFNIGVEARVGERTRVARELHDTLLQTVQGSKMVADEALKNAADHRLVVRALEQLSTWLAQATEEGRAALNSLRAPGTETDDLAQSVRQAIDECRPTSRAEISMAVNGESKAIHPVVRDEVYRIAYEAIRNACTHSGGDRIDVSLVYGNDLTVRINDNGSGIEPRLIETGREGHFGLRGMQERAERIGGKLTIVGPSGLGSSVTLVVPGRTAASGS